MVEEGSSWLMNSQSAVTFVYREGKETDVT